VLAMPAAAAGPVRHRRPIDLRRRGRRLDVDSTRFTAARSGAGVATNGRRAVARHPQRDQRARNGCACVSIPFRRRSSVPVEGGVFPLRPGRRRLVLPKIETAGGGRNALPRTVRDFGWHAGFGAELKLGKHAGLHGDYPLHLPRCRRRDDDEDDGADPQRSCRATRGRCGPLELTMYF
jgi:hypothetical protein